MNLVGQNWPFPRKRIRFLRTAISVLSNYFENEFCLSTQNTYIHRAIIFTNGKWHLLHGAIIFRKGTIQKIVATHECKKEDLILRYVQKEERNKNIFKLFCFKFLSTKIYILKGGKEVGQGNNSQMKYLDWNYLRKVQDPIIYK